MMTTGALLAGLAAFAFVGLFRPDLAAQPAARQTDPVAGETLSQSYRGSQRENVAYQKIAPFKLFDNLYYVGPGFVSVWLIPTSDGLILIDTVQEPYVDHVLDGIRKSGCDPKDITYILITHAHRDHYGGAARIQELSGARVGMADEDWKIIEQAAASATAENRAALSLPKRDLVLREGDIVMLGDTTLKVYLTPGHTPGVLSLEFTVHDGSIPHRALLQGGAGPRSLAAAEQSLASMNRISEMQGIEVGLTVHSWLPGVPYPGGNILERAQMLAQRKPGSPHPFVDPEAFREWIKINQAKIQAYIEAQKVQPSNDR